MPNNFSAGEDQFQKTSPATVGTGGFSPLGRRRLFTVRKTPCENAQSPGNHRLRKGFHSHVPGVAKVAQCLCDMRLVDLAGARSCRPGTSAQGRRLEIPTETRFLPAAGHPCGDGPEATGKYTKLRLHPLNLAPANRCRRWFVRRCLTSCRREVYWRVRKQHKSVIIKWPVQKQYFS